MWGKSFVPSLQQPHLGKLSHQLRGASWPELSIAFIFPISVFLGLPQWHCLIPSCLCGSYSHCQFHTSPSHPLSPCAATPSGPNNPTHVLGSLISPSAPLSAASKTTTKHTQGVCVPASLNNSIWLSSGSSSSVHQSSQPWIPRFSSSVIVNKVTFSSQLSWLINNKPIPSPSDSFTSASFWRDTSKKRSLKGKHAPLTALSVSQQDFHCLCTASLWIRA